MNNYKKDLNTNNVNNITNNVTNNAQNNAIPNIGGGTFTYTKTITSGNGNPFINGNMNIPNVNVPVNNSNSTNCNNKEFRIISIDKYRYFKEDGITGTTMWAVMSTLITGILIGGNYLAIKGLVSLPYMWQRIVIASTALVCNPLLGWLLFGSIKNSKGYIESVKTLKKCYKNSNDKNNITIPSDLIGPADFD